MSESLDDLDALIRRVDPDRWLSSRFVADRQARADLIALYAYDHEITRAPRMVSNPLLGEIRLTWWREALDEIYAGDRVRRHPAADALTSAVRRHDLERAMLEAPLDARYDDLEAVGYADDAALNAWLDAAYGVVAGLAARMLDSSVDPTAARAAARAWGLSRLDPSRLPPGFDIAAGVRGHLRDSRRGPHALSSVAFPAIAHATLAGADRRGPLTDRLRVAWAVVRGRV